MKVFMLDLSKCKEPQLDGYDKPIPCKIGEHSHNLDVIEERIKPDVLAAWQKEADGRLKAKGIKMQENIPIGLNLRTMPVGAVLTVIEVRRNDVP